MTDGKQLNPKMKRFGFDNSRLVACAAALVILSLIQSTVSASALLQFDFNQAVTWPQALQKTNAPAVGVLAAKVGTIDVAGSKEASGGLLLIVDRPAREGWSSSIQSGLLALQNRETNLGKLTVSFSLSASRALPVKVRVESFNENRERTGGLETTVYPAAADFYQRYALDLSALQAVGVGVFDPVAPFVSFNFEISSDAGWPGATRHELRLDNVHYASPAFYVGPQGADANDGLTERTAFASPQKAVAAAQPGDIILLMNGAYGRAEGQTNHTPVVRFVRPGSPAGWIVLKNYPGHAPVLSAVGQHAISITQAEPLADGEIRPLAYLEIRGLRIRGNGDTARQDMPGDIGKFRPNTNARGIHLKGDSAPNKIIHHVRIADNRVEFCVADGIYLDYADWMAVEGNEVYDNCWITTGYVPSGIVIMHHANFDSVDNTHKFLVRDNRIAGNRLTVFNSEKGTKYWNGNGILIDDNCTRGFPQAYLGRTLVQNNLVCNNGGGGIQMWGCHRLDIINNTLFHNGTTPELKWGNLGVEFCNDVRIINNLVVAQPDRPLDSWMATRMDKDTAKIIRVNNLYWGGVSPNVEGINDLVADPLFVNAATNPAVADFRLQAGSPALQAGRWEIFSPAVDLDGKPRPANRSPDIGAYQK
jgi:hypothetical protein